MTNNTKPIAAKIDTKLWHRFKVEAAKREVKLKDWWPMVIRAGLDAIAKKEKP